MFTSMLLIFFLVWLFMNFFWAKIITLLSLEGMMLSCIVFSQFTFLKNQNQLFILLILSVFMVLDSVLGITLLISSSRCSSTMAKLMF